MNGRVSKRTCAIFALISACLLFLFDYFRDGLPAVVVYWAGGALYVMFWIFVVSCLNVNNTNNIAISTLTTLTTCAIEFSQLWHPVWLDKIRNYKIGYAILGTTFSWADFPPYFLGGVFGYLGLWVLEARRQTKIR